MKIRKTSFEGLYILEPERLEDTRGFFARTWSKKEAIKYNLDEIVAQCSIAYNKKKGTIRGLHYQANPYGESKLVRVTMGSIFDVVVDIRPKSKTYLKYFSAELSAENRKQLYIPKGIAHGYQTLMDKTEVFYQISMEYKPSHTRGIRYDDPNIGILWPLKTSIISDRDKTFQLLK